jgi:hypothetical protein
VQQGDQVFVDGGPLVCFHFADLQQISPSSYSTNTAAALIWLTPTIRRAIFHPYIRALREVAPEGLPKSLRRVSPRDLLSVRGPLIVLRTLRNIAMMEYVLVRGERCF